MRMESWKSCLFVVTIFTLLKITGGREECVDMDKRCKKWADDGECTKNKGWMTKNCRLSCRSCAGKCVDKEKFCPLWKKSVFCSKRSQWYGYMRVTCPKSCQFCNVPINGGWSNWGPYGPCTKICGGGMKMRSRLCDNPKQFAYGSPCAGPRTEIAPCNISPCPEKCIDKEQKLCSEWRKQNLCASDSVYMKLKCARSCGFCKERCADNNEHCPRWAKLNFCSIGSKWSGYMRKICPTSCRFCKAERLVAKDTECKDRHHSTIACSNWAKNGECSKENKKWMHLNCKHSCGLCPGAGPACIDIHDTISCQAWAKEGECQRNAKWMSEYCKRSCNKCLPEPSEKVDESLTEINGKYCGVRLKARVAGGKDAALGDWPWQVGIERKSMPGVPFCGGSLINRQWVLSAAHCFGNHRRRIYPKIYAVRLGDSNLTSNEGTELVVGISKIIRHEDYSSMPLTNDIMLLKLERPVSYNQYIKPICLPTQGKSEKVQDWCYVTGWGLLGRNGGFARILQEAKLPIIARNECKKTMDVISSFTENMICSGIKKGGVDSCRGDSGGPFVCENGGLFELTGIVSWGVDCARSGYYGVYVKVSKYIDWIEKNIKA